MIEVNEGDGAEINVDKSVVKDGSEECEDDESNQISTFDEAVGELVTLAAQIIALIGINPVVVNPFSEHVYPEERVKEVAVASQEKVT